MDRQKAIEELHSRNAKRLRKLVAKARRGKFDYCFTQFGSALHMAGLVLEDLGLTQADVDQFAHGYYVQEARKGVAKARAGTSSWEVRHSRYLIDDRGVTHAEADTTPKELRRLYHEEAIRVITEALTKCRSGEFEQGGNSAEQSVNGLFYELENYGMTPKAAGISQAEVDSFMRLDALALIRHLMKQVREDQQDESNYLNDYYRWGDMAWGAFRLIKKYNFPKEELADEMTQAGADLEMVAYLTGEGFVKSWARFVTYSEGRLSDLEVVTTVIDNWQLGLSPEEVAVLTQAEQILLKWAEGRDIDH